MNAGGGVFGQPVEFAEGDTLHPEEEARRLIEDEGVHAIVGPNSSADSLLVVGAAAPAGLAVTGARPVAGLLQGGAAARCRPGVLLPFAGLDQPLSALD